MMILILFRIAVVVFTTAFVLSEIVFPLLKHQRFFPLTRRLFGQSTKPERDLFKVQDRIQDINTRQDWAMGMRTLNQKSDEIETVIAKKPHTKKGKA